MQAVQETRLSPKNKLKQPRVSRIINDGVTMSFAAHLFTKVFHTLNEVTAETLTYYGAYKHAVAAYDSHTYNYDADGSQVGRVLDGDGYTLANNDELADQVVPPADTNLHPDPHRNRHGGAGPRSRIYDGYCTENPDVYIAVKTSIGGVTYGTQAIRNQLAFDSELGEITGKPPMWIFANLHPRAPLMKLKDQSRMPWYQ